MLWGCTLSPRCVFEFFIFEIDSGSGGSYILYMKKTLLAMCAIGLAVSLDIAKADGGVYPGNLDKQFHLRTDEEYKGHVIEACEAYMAAVADSRDPRCPLSAQEHKDRIALLKEELMQRIEKYPDEINDTYWGHHALVASPFYAAVYGNDCDLLQYVLKKGALPFMPEYCYSGLKLSRDVESVLYHARSQYNILEICLKAKKAGVKIEGEEPTGR